MTDTTHAETTTAAATLTGAAKSGRNPRRAPKNRSQQSLRRPPREAYSTRTTSFDSDGEQCVGTLYLPAGPTVPPVVVMAPGLGMWRSFGLPAIAERFAEAGYAVLLFDFRHHGDSGGEPRGLVDPKTQIADYEAAISKLRDTDTVDSGGIVLWGHSFSGGHVLSVAAADSRVAGIIATAPFVDGRRELRRSIRQPTQLLRATAAGLRDVLGSKLGRGHDVRLVDDDGFAVITEPGAKRGVLDIIDRESDWENRLPARVFLSLTSYRPITSVESIRCPVLIIGGRDDQVVPAADAAAAADRIPTATYRELSADHLSLLGEQFETLVDHQLTFLRSVVEP
ncbi:MAG: lysophospholipase [uncultured archaeon A07HN63]|nr:MAG: lysophospholipase [uncultured archaeon A07HN63]